jgi:hypothetical protein
MRSRHVEEAAEIFIDVDEYVGLTEKGGGGPE